MDSSTFLTSNSVVLKVELCHPNKCVKKKYTANPLSKAKM